MKKGLYLSLIFVLTCGIFSGAASFKIRGHISGLQKGDTLRFERVIPPSWDFEHAFDIIVEHPDSFSYTGTQEHDQYYLMKYLPKEGVARHFDRLGLSLIITNGDSISIPGTVDEIYYCIPRGGIYEDSLLTEALLLDRSLGMIRSNYLREAEMARSQNDSIRAEQYTRLFNEFGKKSSDPRFDKARQAREAYATAHPSGSPYLIIEALQTISYEPIQKSKDLYGIWSPELKESYYGRLYAKLLSDMERLAEGQPTPAFTATAIDGIKVTQSDFNGRYLLIYHWGLCPGSVFIDGKVRELYDRYSGLGLDVLGLTESLADIRNLYDSLPENKKTPYVYVDDLRPVVEGMLSHPWKEIELTAGHPGNISLKETFGIGGWPFFVLIGPDGTIMARGFSEAFHKAENLLSDAFDSKAN